MAQLSLGHISSPSLPLWSLSDYAAIHLRYKTYTLTYLQSHTLEFMSQGILAILYQVPVPPILGSYQLKEEENQLRVSVTLKLHESVKNSFEYCEAHLPFFNR